MSNNRKMKPKNMVKRSRIRRDEKGEYIYRHSFIRGKQKLTKVYLFEGVPMDTIDLYEYYLENADDITLLQDGEYDELYRRYSADDASKTDSDEKLPF